jgi:hypothetical protein
MPSDASVADGGPSSTSYTHTPITGASTSQQWSHACRVRVATDRGVGKGGVETAMKDYLLVQAHTHFVDRTAHEVGNLDKQLIERLLHLDPVCYMINPNSHPHC